jgi:hypothetical protein
MDILPHYVSTFEAALYEHLSTHAQREGEILERYVEASRTTGSRALAYIVDMLAADERRHHALFTDLASALRTSAELSPEEPAVPRLDFRTSDLGDVLALTRELIKGEEDDLHELKGLRKELGDLEDTTLWALLVDTMRLDTEKHLTMLRFVEQHAKRAAKLR